MSTVLRRIIAAVRPYRGTLITCFVAWLIMAASNAVIMINVLPWSDPERSGLETVIWTVVVTCVVGVLQFPLVFLAGVGPKLLRERKVRSWPWTARAALWLVWVCVLVYGFAIVYSLMLGMLGFVLLMILGYFVTPIVPFVFLGIGLAEGIRRFAIAARDRDR